MSCFQSAVIAKHQTLIRQSPGEQSAARIIPEGQIGQQVNQYRYAAEKYHAEKNCFLYIGKKAFDNVGMGNTQGVVLGMGKGVTVFLHTPVKNGKENYCKTGSGVYPRPFAGNAKPHADTACTQGKQGFAKRGIVKA